MKNDKIYNQWTDFINDSKYSKYFLSNEEQWNIKLEEVKKYIDENDKRPSNHDSNKEIKQLGTWISTQLQNYKKKSQTMKNDEIYNQWTDFINDSKYSKYFLSNEEQWNIKLEEVKKYIDENDKRPIKQLATWINTQLHNYNKVKKSMKNDEIYKQWTDFINDPKYSKYF